MGFSRLLSTIVRHRDVNILTFKSFTIIIIANDQKYSYKRRNSLRLIYPIRDTKIWIKYCMNQPGGMELSLLAVYISLSVPLRQFTDLVYITSLWPIHTVQTSNMQYAFRVQLYGKVL